MCYIKLITCSFSVHVKLLYYIVSYRTCDDSFRLQRGCRCTFSLICRQTLESVNLCMTFRKCAVLEVQHYYCASNGRFFDHDSIFAEHTIYHCLSVYGSSYMHCCRVVHLLWCQAGFIASNVRLSVIADECLLLFV